MTRFTFLPPGVFPSPLTVAPLHPSLLRSGPEAQGPRTASRGAQNAPRPRHSHWARGLARGFRHWAKSTLLAITSSLYRVCSLCSPSFSGQSRPGLAVSRERAWASSHYRQHTARPLWYQNQELKKSKHQKQKITNISKIFQNLNISTDRTGSKKHGGATKAGGRCYLFLPAQYFLIMSDTISPIMMTGALVFPDTSVGMMDASATRSPEIPYTLKVAGKLEKSADTCWHTEVTELVFSFHENSYNNGKNLCLNTWLPKSIINKFYH